MQYTLHLTDGCNLACRYCPPKNGKNVMSRETAFKAVDLALAGLGKTAGIGFYGGEPLLCKRLIEEIVQYTKKKNTGGKRVFFKLTTNGTLLDSGFLQYAKREGILLSLSLDGNEQMHGTNRVDKNGDGTYSQIVKIIPELLSMNPYTAVMMTIAPNTAGYFYDGVKNLFSLGFTNIICSLDYSADWDEKMLFELKKQYQKMASLYYEKTVREDKFFFSPFDSKIDSHIQNKEYCRERCKLGFEQISVSPNGTLYPCVQFVGDEIYCIGHVGTGIDENRRREIYRQSRIEQTECKDCAVKNRCLHSCACVNKYSTGQLNTPSPVLCANERMLIKIADRVAARLYQKRDGMFIHKHYNENYPLISLIEDMKKQT